MLTVVVDTVEDTWFEFGTISKDCPPIGTLQLINPLLGGVVGVGWKALAL